jgi:hypothetical protein
VIKIEARGAQLESSALTLRRHLDMRRLVVTSGSLLAKTRPLDSQSRLLLLRQKRDGERFWKGRSVRIVDQVGQILPTWRFWGRPLWHWDCNRGK